MTPHKSLIKTLITTYGLIALTACSSIAPLDPIIGDTGKPFSDVAKSTDVISYGLDLEIFPESKSIAGVGYSQFLITQDTSQVELKLDSRFDIIKVLVDDRPATYQRIEGVITIDLGKSKTTGDTVNIAVHYFGKPHIALNAPWSGGFVWSETDNGMPWIATAVQGEGCDLFWPCKDHFADKADSMEISLTVPKSLSAVTNGVLQSIDNIGTDKHKFNWKLSVPASDYNIALNIGPFTRIQQSYTSVNGQSVPIEFWALNQNTEKAQDLINNDLLQQISFYESLLGPYPWGDQKLGFVETPHLGMEHQTINAYGKNYVRDKNGFDWLLHHELAHEWFGNLITHEQLNDAWLHEGFGLYMQPAYSLYKFGNAAYINTMYQSYLGLVNCYPVVMEGVITSDQAFNSDIYGKGGWTLHTLRWLIGDELFWQATRELLYATNETASLSYPIAPRYRNTQDFIDIVNKITGEDYTWLFDVYLKQAALPELLQSRTDNELILTWQTPENLAFPMPITISINGESSVYTTKDKQISVEVKPEDHVIIDPDMQVLRYLPIIGLCEENQAKRKKKR
ncbi:M1 family metallopeptidase [uncultured Paraglaciecola sp.]|uniref:M1 family metallopeptidase n=1 Tax=uncultured Paraglaciecola sp. TaxID=1765024 RepID=UPI0030D98D79|tara:strand:+ start:350032 stop:351732 length:1701 start_codon:yes stop_codon:yes gene_type:complete